MGFEGAGGGAVSVLSGAGPRVLGPLQALEQHRRIQEPAGRGVDEASAEVLQDPIVVVRLEGGAAAAGLA
ncbi:hypothetical protein [Streptomyces puniciscabiei]|uniref:hypothetical protein n=1 Tax=Streptomyces puniciscabiei TaxID=164348 RepID=UPI003330EBD9